MPYSGSSMGKVVCDMDKYSWDNLQEQEGIAESPEMLITEFRG